MMVKIIHRAADRVAVEQITIGFFEFIVRSFERKSPRCSLTAPTLPSIDMPLSFRITMSGSPDEPALLSPS